MRALPASRRPHDHSLMRLALHSTANRIVHWVMSLGATEADAMSITGYTFHRWLHSVTNDGMLSYAFHDMLRIGYTWCNQ